MEITEVRIKLMEDSDDRLQAFCSITFDNCFVIRDLKIIDGTNGPFVAMPSRKLTSHCHQCGSKNHLKAAYCNQCGARQREDRTMRDADGRAKLYADIAHPINSTCREMIQARVIAEFRSEQVRAKQPGYVSKYDDDYDDDIDSASLVSQESARGGAAAAGHAPAAAPTSSSPASQPPAPHIFPREQPAKNQGEKGQMEAAEESPGSTGGPHFGSAGKRDATAGPPPSPTKPKSRGEFGTGIF
jgi:stage V sporulation protein G